MPRGRISARSGGWRSPAAEWRAADRDRASCIRGARLEQVASWADATDLAIGRPERAYLKASLDEREREQSDQDARVRREEQLERRSRFRLRALAAVLAVATIVATSLIALRGRTGAEGHP